MGRKNIMYKINQMVKKIKYVLFIIVYGVLFIGCGGGGSGSTETTSPEPAASVTGSLSTGDAYETSSSGTASYYVTVSDDVIVGAHLIATKNVYDEYGIQRDSKVCEGFTELGNGRYSLNNCSTKPAFVTAVGGFIDLNKNNQLDDEEATQISPLVVDTTVLSDSEFTITPLGTLAAADYTINRTTLATKLGFTSRAAAFQATSSNISMNQKVNAILSAANSSGFDLQIFTFDLVTRILASSSTGITAIKDAVSSLVNASESQTKYGEARVRSFWSDSRVQAVINGTDAMSAMLSKKVPTGRMRVSGLITTTPTGSNIVSGATVSLYIGAKRLSIGASDSNGKYSLEITEASLTPNSILVIKADKEGTIYNSFVPTNQILSKMVNGQINPSHIGALAVSNLTTSVYDYTLNPVSAPCTEGKYSRVKTGECLTLENSTWGFQGFTIPEENVYPLLECTQSALQNLINSIDPVEGGHILMPACTIATIDGIKIPDNVILEGTGIGKTVLSNTVSSSSSPASAIYVLGKNITLRNFTLIGNGTTLNGINGPTSKGNILVEFIESKDYKNDQGAGIAFLRESAIADMNITIRYNITSNGLHGINIWGLKQAVIYSNESFSNKNYGIDVHSDSDIEIAGNYLHTNDVAGSKSPDSTNINYHHNDINDNGEAGLVYIDSKPTAVITVKENNLANNGGPAYAAWNTDFAQLYLINNIVLNSTDVNGYAISVPGVKRIDITGDHGKIWTDGANTVYYH